MKILLTADWHIGIRGDSDIYHKIFETWLTNFLVPTIREYEVKKLFILGDFFDNRNVINIKSFDLSIWAIEYLTMSFPELEVILIIGNHDIYYRNRKDVNSLQAFKRFNRVSIIDQITFTNFEDRDFYLVPWITNEEELKNLFKSKGDICLGHFEFKGYDFINGVTSHNGLDLKDFTDRFTKVFTGHFHLRNAPYVGNPFHMSWADTEDQKGVTILDTRTLKETFVPNNISPIYKKIFLSQLKNKTVSLDICKNNFIKVYLDSEYTDKMLETIDKVIQMKKPLSYSFEGLTEDKLEEAQINDLTNPVESLILWLNDIELKKGIDREKLITKMNTLYKGVE